jgi:hypothetical protein
LAYRYDTNKNKTTPSNTVSKRTDGSNSSLRPVLNPGSGFDAIISPEKKQLQFSLPFKRVHVSGRRKQKR